MSRTVNRTNRPRKTTTGVRAPDGGRAGRVAGRGGLTSDDDGRTMSFVML